MSTSLPNIIVKPARVLIVEDDAMFRDTVRETLVGAGYLVDAAADGPAGLALAAERRPDLVLLDFDLPRMMGDEVLERLLALRPGLVCFVLSGKDDLHQALWMGRRGAFGWIDKYVGTGRLLSIVADGLKTRPQGSDLQRLVTTHYPQSVAAPVFRLARLPVTAAPVERLAAQRDVFEGLVEYLGAAAAMMYLQRGLLEEQANEAVLRAIVAPAIDAWLDVLTALTPLFAAEPRCGWWHDLAIVLARPVAGSDSMHACAATLRPFAPLECDGDPCTPLGLLRAWAAYHPLWQFPDRLPTRQAPEAAAAIGPALDELLGALALLADVEIGFVRTASLTAAGQYEHNVSLLSGLTIHNRQVARPDALRTNGVYLLSRSAGQAPLPLGPLVISEPCEPGALAPRGVFVLQHWTPVKRAAYFSRACGHVCLMETEYTLSALRRLRQQLDPRGVAAEHPLDDMAVALLNVCGFTTLTRERGPAVARECVERMAAAVRDAALQFGGHTAPSVGDEILARFADAAAAVRGAIAVLRTLRRLNQRNSNPAVHVHVGLDFGAGFHDGDQVWGDVVNRAKRCQSLAGLDELVVAPSVARAMAGELDVPCEPLQGHLKGFGDGEVFRVNWNEGSGNEGGVMNDER